MRVSKWEERGEKRDRRNKWRHNGWKCLKFVEHINLHIQETQWIQVEETQRLIPRHIIFILLKDKEKTESWKQQERDSSHIYG